jgi:aspartokinase/homoserine dehydrogenase 1
METEQFTDFVVGHGELWCAQLVAAACEVLGGEARFMDTREVLVRAY